MLSHLKYSGLPLETQRDRLEEIIRSSPLLMNVLTGLRDDGLPDHLLVAGAIYNLVWNRLTDRPELNGVNDVDVFYFD
ncbi:MAG: nucleotidyltransferase family protein, partial [Devosia sp.]